MWGLIAAGASLWSGYLTGQMTIRNQIENLEARVRANEVLLANRRKVMVCGVRSLDQINNNLHFVPPCAIDIPE